MIVQDAGADVLLITQPDHARAAREVMEQWPSLVGHPRRDDILLAIEHHDAMWARRDAAPAVDVKTGNIVDFIHDPIDVKQEWRAIDVTAVTARPWAAALIAHHRRFVYARYRGTPDWSRFFDEVDHGCVALQTAAGHAAEALLADYTYVRLGDLISLAFCTGWTEAERYEQWTVVRAPNGVEVQPRQFGCFALISVPARRLPKRRFADDADLQQAWDGADRMQLSGTVHW